MKISWKAVFIVVGFFYGFSMTSVASSAPMQVAVGEYYSKAKMTFPFLAVSDTYGKNWSSLFINKEQFPSDFNNYGLLTGVNCNSSFCVATGYYSAKDKNNYQLFPPFLAVSKNQGKAWTYRSIDYENEVHLSSVSCNQQICTAVGISYDKSLKKFPFATVLSNQGDTHSYPESIVENLPLNEEAALNNVSCSDSVCVAIGGYRDLQKNGLPLIAVTKDQGKVWEYPMIKFPVYYKNAVLSHVNCKDNVCVAVGHYDRDNKKALPFFLVSHDKGSSWQISSISSPLVIEDNHLFKSLTCHHSTCIATGVYNLYDPSPVPLFMMSTDKGFSWFYPKDFSSMLPTKDAAYTSINDVSCHGVTCIAVGEYRGEEGYLHTPLLAISHDIGKTWAYKIPWPDSYGDLNNISCNENYCSITGYAVMDENVQLPFLVVSHDNGLTWTTPLNTSTLPDFIGGRIHGLSALF